MYGKIPLLKEVIADVCRLRPTKFIFVMRGSRQFCQRGSNYDNVVFSFVHERRRGERIQFHNMPAIIDPPAKRHKMAFRWRADNDPTLNAGYAAL